MARRITDPFEMADDEFSGWAFESLTQIYSTNELSRKWKTFGGDYSLRHNGNSVASGVTTPDIDPGTETRHIFAKFGYYPSSVSAAIDFRFLDSSDAILATVESASIGSWKAYRGNGSALLEDSFVSPTKDKWNLIEIEMFTDDTNGVVRVWQDDILIIEQTGVDTTNNSNDILKIEFYLRYQSYIDDMVVNNITMKYETEASGPFVVGELITGGTSGATAYITKIQDDGTTGVLTLHRWDGTPFQDAEQITAAGGTTADVVAPNAAYINGFEPNSGRPGNGYIVAIEPNANGANSQLTGSDADSTDNYLLVDERVTTGSPATYVDATAADQKDTYKGDISSALPAAVDSISFVGVGVYAQSSLTGIDGINSVVRISGADYDGDRVDLTAAYDTQINGLPVDPSIADTLDQSWDLSVITDSGFEFGTKFVA